MPSRKKAKGQARKAEKAKNEAAERARKEEESIRELEQSQIQRLQISNQSSVPSFCMHGFDPFPDDHVCSKFIRAFVLEFFKCMRRYPDLREDERGSIECLLESREVTKEEYSEIWNNADKMKQVIKYFLYNGTMHILAGTVKSRISSFFARFFEEWLKAKIHKSQACIDWLKVIESISCDRRTVVKFFWRRIRCPCLDEKYKGVKLMPKRGVCFYPQCSGEEFVERRKVRCCSRCRSVTYCSRECQVADWSKHTSFCDEVAAAKAEFDASQQNNPTNWD